MPLTEACLFWWGGLWRRRLALRWAGLRAGVRWKLVEGGGWGLRHPGRGLSWPRACRCGSVAGGRSLREWRLGRAASRVICGSCSLWSLIWVEGRNFEVPRTGESCRGCNVYRQEFNSTSHQKGGGQLKNQRLSKTPPPLHQRKSARFRPVTEQREMATRRFPRDTFISW